MSEPETIQALAGFFSGIAQNCIVGVLTEWKKERDEKGEKERADYIARLERSKALQLRVEQQINAALRDFRIGPSELEILLRLRQPDALRSEISAQIRSHRYSADSIAKLILNAAPELATHADTLEELARRLVDAIRATIASDSQLMGVLGLEYMAESTATLETLDRKTSEIQNVVGDVKSTLTADNQKTHQLLQDISAKIDSRMLSISSASTTKIEEIHKSQNQRHFDRARAQLLYGSIVRAEELYQELITDLEAGVQHVGDKKLLFRAYTNLGSSLWQQEKAKDAIPWFEKAYLATPNDPIAKVNWVTICIHREDYDVAEQLLNEILSADPTNADGLNRLSLLQVTREDYSAALKTLSRKNPPTEDSHLLGAHVLSCQGDYTTAAKEARLALQLNPNSEQALVAVSDALGIPIIRAKAKLKTTGSGLTADERKALEEAIQKAESAQAVLRKQERHARLAGVLTNLSAYYLALDFVEKAVTASQEASVLAPHDKQPLLNLFAAQMFMGKYTDACTTSDRAVALERSRSSYVMRMEALIAASRPEDALKAYDEAKAALPAIATDLHVSALRAAALFKLPQIDTAFEVINQAIASDPSEPELYLQRGRFFENIGKLSEAETDNKKAESLARLNGRLDVVLRSALFFVGQSRWPEALERFEEVGATNIDSSVFTEFLICLFNTKQYSRCLPLVEQAIQQKTFNAAHHELAARCYSMTGDVPRAIGLLDKLVKRGGSKELDHRELLAQNYFRLDEIDKAYDVLIVALPNHKEDVLLLSNLSGLSILKGLHREAVIYAANAVAVDPTDERANWALVNAVLTLPESEKPASTHIDAFNKSLKYLGEKFPGSGLQAIPADQGIEIISKMLKEQHDRAKFVWDLVRQRKLPMAFLARAVGRSPFAVWSGLSSGGELYVYMADGTLDEQQREQLAATKADGISLDIFALLTLRHLDKLDLLPKMFEKIYAYTEVLECISKEIHELEARKEKGYSVVAHTGESLQMTEIPPKAIEAALAFLKPIQSFLKSGAVELCGVDVAVLANAANNKAALALGALFHHPMVVAGNKSVAFYCDDVGLRNLARAELKVDTFCSQALLRVAQAKGLISAEEHEDAVLLLLQSNYSFVSEGAGTLIRLLKKDNYTLSPLSQKLARRITEPNILQDACARNIGAVIAHIWRCIPSSPGTSKDQLFRVFLEALLVVNKPAELFPHFGFGLGQEILTQPDVFVGITLRVISSGMLSRADRFAWINSAHQWMRYLSILSREKYPWWPKLSASWDEKAEIFERIIRLGLI